MLKSFVIRRRRGNGPKIQSEGGVGPSSVDENLDVAFYRSRHPDLGHLDDEALRLHWAQFGRDEKRAPNARAAVLNHSRFPQIPPDFNPVAYWEQNRDLSDGYKDPFVATLHFLDYGIAERRRHKAEADSEFVAAYRRHRPPADREEADPRLHWRPITIDQYLYLFGFTNSAFLKHFDPVFYAAMARVPAFPGLYDAVFHFAENGVTQLLPIAETLAFDPPFHRRQLRSGGYDQVTALSDVDLYRHWLSQDAFEAFPGTHHAYMRREFGVAETSAAIDPSVYRSANADLRAMTDAELSEHAFRYGLTELRSSIRFTRDNVLTYIQHADHLHRTDEADKAERLYRRLLHFFPDNAHLNQRLGDLSFRREDYEQSYAHYDRNIATNQANQWTFINAATCCDRLGDLGRAVDVANAGCESFPEDVGLLGFRTELSERFFTDEVSYAHAVALGGRISDAQGLLTRAAARCDFPLPGRAPSRAVGRIALVANLDIFQCALYRVEQKAEQLAAAGLDARIYDWSRDCETFEREMIAHDAVIFYRVAAFPRILRAINAARAAGLTVFYDIDDLVFDAERFPEPFSDYAGQITWAEYVDICMGVPLFGYALQQCDYAIASTPFLAEQMRPLVRRRQAFVHRNALGLRHEAAIRARRPERGGAGPVRIFYGSGTKAHKFDFEQILLPALQEVDRRFGREVEIVIVGHRPLAVRGDVLPQARFVPVIADIEEYWALLAESDISLSVLRRADATNAKSEIKWLEAAMFGVPSVVSNTATFEEVVEDGVDGFIAATSADFVERISALVRDRARREAMGEAARRKALDRYGLDEQVKTLRTMMSSVAPDAAERTRVLVVNVFYAPQAKGGATRVVIDNVRDIRELYPEEFEFEIFTTLEGAPDPYAVHVTSFEDVRVTAMVAGAYPYIDLATTDDRAARVFQLCVERFSPHVIHFHCIQRITASATDYARGAGIPYVITAHDGWWISDRQFLYDRNGPAERYHFDQPLRVRPEVPGARYDRPARLLPSLKGAGAVLAVSDAFAGIYRETGLGNVRSVPNGVPRFVGALMQQRSPATDAADRAPDPSRRRVRIAHIGGLEAHKGFGLVKNAIFAVRPKNIEMLAVDLALLPGSERIEDWSGTPVRIVARRSQADVVHLYEEIDVLFAPSLWPESYGLITREALAAGCWVVASDRGAVGEPVVEDENGHVVSVDDLSGLIGVIERIDADPGRYARRIATIPAFRTSRDQAEDLVRIYREFSGRPAQG